MGGSESGEAGAGAGPQTETAQCSQGGAGALGRGVRAGVGGTGHCRSSGEMLAPAWEGCARLKGQSVQTLGMAN